MLTYASLTGPDVASVIEDVARLRIRVFRDFPYLYDGTLAYERDYLARFAASAGAVVVVARDGADIVGAATGCPLAAEHEAFQAPFLARGLDVASIFYCAESVLLPDYRGQGAGHRFFDLREQQARALGASHAAFCAVARPEDHPARPPKYAPLDPFWRKRGYAPVPGLVTEFSWRDLDQPHDTLKPMQFWMRDL
ncbi:MAG: GNAT family N-acetyltransferase [Rhizobiales bacterium]|nr:GNAT family N-acetyltransferase [Hyphomicrobiales bacterium]